MPKLAKTHIQWGLRQVVGIGKMKASGFNRWRTRVSPHPRAGTMKIRVLTIISVGITIGILLGMSVIALLRALIDGESVGLEVSFTVLTGVMAAFLITYVAKTFH